MTTIEKLNLVTKVLVDHGFSNELVCVTHDKILFTPVRGDDEFQQKMKNAGAKFNEEYGWFVYS